MIKVNRIIENILEFALLCAVAYFCIAYMAKDVANHDRIVIVFLLCGYGAVICVNFLLQTILLLNFAKTNYRYFLAKIKLFAILLAVLAVFTLFLGLEWFSFFSIFFAVIFIGHIVIVVLLFLFDTFLQSKPYRTWISRKRNRILQYSVISSTFIAVIVYITMSVLNERQEYKWKSSCYSNTIESYSAYIQQYPKGKYLEKAIWKIAEKTDNIDTYDSYIEKYPNGRYVEESLFNKALLLKSEKAVSEYLEIYPAGVFKKPLELMLNSESGKFIDERDGQEYGWVKIGEQIWMAENLNNKTPDSHCYTGDVWIDLDNKPTHNNCDEENSEKFGRLYSWNDAYLACPKGWRLPDNSDWEMLKKNIEWKTICPDCQIWKDGIWVEGVETDGEHFLLQSKTKWNGNNATGFSAIPTFHGKTSWLSSSVSWVNDFGHEYVNVWQLDDMSFRATGDTKNSKFFIRCIKIE